MTEAKINLFGEIENFAPHEDVRHALLLTYNFDGPFIEESERGLLDVLWRRNCTNILVVRDGRAVVAEKGKQSHRYAVVNAAYSKRTFHPKLVLLLSSSEILAAVGSANLTRGGLETNLELVNIYRLSCHSGPRKFFVSLRDYVLRLLNLELSLNAPTQQAAKQLVADLDTFLAETTAVHGFAEPLLLHNYEKPLWPQIVGSLPAKRLESLWVVSPFYEPPPGAAEDPPDDAPDRSLLANIFESFSFSGKQSPPLRFYFQADGKGLTLLPVPLLRHWKNSIELYQKNSTADDKRALHGKMLALAGRAANGKHFVTLVVGSANFTRAALLAMPPNGNAELVVLTTFFRPDDLAERLADHLNLNQLFSKVEDWDRLTVRALPPKRSTPAVEVFEGWVSLAERQVRVFFRASAAVHRLVVTMLSASKDKTDPLMLGEMTAPLPQFGEFKLPEAAIILSEPGGGVRQLPYHRVRVEAFDDKGRLLGTGEAELNVDCPERFCGDWLCSAEESRLEDRIYQAGLGVVADYASMRQQVERVLSAAERGHDESAPKPSHQADLDVFFRRLHLGFRGLSLRLHQGDGSAYDCRGALRQLAQWAQEAAQKDELHSVEQRLYIADRILRAAADCVEIMWRAKRPVSTIATILHEDFLDRAAPLAVFVREQSRDPSLGVAGRDLMARWRTLQKQYPPVAKS